MDDERGCPPLHGDAAPSVARCYIREIGSDWDGEVLECALLATSELVTNATLHGGDLPTLDVHTCDGTIRVEVYDSGRTPEAWTGLTGRGPGPGGGTRPGDDLCLGGRGLNIVEAVSERWGVTEQPLGKVVWFEMRCLKGRPPSAAS